MSGGEKELGRLIDKYLDGVIEPEDVRILNRLLETDPEAAGQFVEAAVTHGLLREEAGARMKASLGAETTPEMSRQSVADSRRRRPVTRRAFTAGRRRMNLAWIVPLAAAAAIIVIAFGFLYRPEWSEPSRAAADSSEKDQQLSSYRVSGGAEDTASHVDSARPASAVSEERPGPERPPERFEVVDTVPAVRKAADRLVEVEPLQIPEWPGPIEQPSEQLVDDGVPPVAPVSNEAETSRPVGRLIAVDGNVYYRRESGDRWFKGSEGIYLQAGDVLDTWFGGAQIEMGEGFLVVCRRKTVTWFGEGQVRVRRGELYCQAGPQSGVVKVVTDDGTVQHLGTKFVVRVGASGTTVVVGEGSVEVSNEEGKVTVEEGHASRVRKGSAPGEPKKADVAREFAWVQPMLPKKEEEEAAFAALSITLINADTDEPIRGCDPIPEGAVIILSKLPTRNLNIRVNVRPAVVGSVRIDVNHVKGFQIDAGTGRIQKDKVEQSPPYSLSDDKGDYNPWTPDPGDYTVTATPYSERGAEGEAGKPVTLHFRVVERLNR